MDLMHFFDMILHVDQTLGMLLAEYGIYVYAVLFAIVFCETGLVVLFFLPWRHPAVHRGRFLRDRRNELWLLMALLITRQ